MLNSADYFGFGFFGWFKANTKSLRTADLMPQISEFQSKAATNYQNFEIFFFYSRPRFSLPELRDILQERNALKARVSDLEDELVVFRPRSNPVQSSPS
jgi:hypothetical protein